MDTTETKVAWKHGWVIGLALLSLVLPVAAVYVRDTPNAAFSDPASLSYYRQTLGALALGLVCAVGAFVASRTLRPPWLRWLSVVLASLGVLLGAFLLIGLIGTCGVQVFSGACQP